MSKISVIGAGNVGATIVNDLMVQGVASEIVLVDVRKQKAIGEALDIYQSAPYMAPASVKAGEYEDTKNSDIVIITCGLPRKPGMTRLELAQSNVNIIRDIAPVLSKFSPHAIYIMVANPVDILTYAFIKYSGLPARQVFGTGTILDTSRLQSELARRFCVSVKNVHAHVYGEHGDSSFIPWSLAYISNNPLKDYKDSSPDKARIDWNDSYDEVYEHVRKSGGYIIEHKGATFYAISMCVCHICKAIYCDTGTALTLSTMMNGEYGLDRVCLSVMTIVDRSGIRGKVINKMTEDELQKLQISGQKLREVLDGLNI